MRVNLLGPLDVRDDAGEPIEVAGVPPLATITDRARAALGPEAYEAAYARGTALTREQALARVQDYL
ncbi:hypothetical protein [Tenggerimyces flavus]|uniref:Uncharacterized protein n=1 Tax=Tenggerimyces flavus TaxID=1708749 RepID=A0ABV7Y5T5_9ACTN|nr:hypothetical protein [Tenggerimyces flavus]MBM7785074.1 ABC-type transporter lipoprotein component MlaA [Tenggerimyces flavus]